MTRKILPSNHNFAFVLLIALLIVVGCVRVCSTYSVFWQTWDEPFHIAAGMEWLDKGRYTYERFHPPLARVMSALGPYLHGIKGWDNLNQSWYKVWDEGNAILQFGGTYEYNLTLARIGILPFFIIASLVVALWAKNCGGIITSLSATLLFTTLPPILAHTGFATLDMACAALVTAALFALTLWLNRPTLLRSCILGISIGLAILSKLPAIGFLVIAGSLIIAVYSIPFFRKSFTEKPVLPKFKQWMTASVVALLLCSLTIWAGYRFSLSPLLRPETSNYKVVNRVFGVDGPIHNIAYFVLENTPVPAIELLGGISDFLRNRNKPKVVYLLGDIRTEGQWYYYPILLLVKTPLPFIVLGALGFFFVFKYALIQRREEVRFLTPVVSVIGVLVVGMLGTINNGVRQILAVYPLLAIVAGYGVSKLLSFHKKFQFVALGLVTILFSWQLISSFAAHPDYLPYFNELAKNHPEEIVVDSDLDWGQDLKRLALTLKNRGINQLAIKYNGSTGIDLNRFHLPAIQELKPYQRETGWIAISIYCLKLGTDKPPYDQFSWLRDYQPVEKVGKSIWLYYIPKN
ncbi:ArnT family glycosyltransferase [Iningainema tapete]|uniref:Glycosyltransferase RgtA/B/C/D-like domain-containing protein n=1 Tax=Iningainema tapete BLCC-T55 TaxID=2748662 RepID=A0A8J7C069_9CYAN|nr:hypothetical protein [Iningainema tapete]MBD2777468.1 hypothetical protein [Iningainema tapete BLCC-T55]